MIKINLNPYKKEKKKVKPKIKIENLGSFLYIIPAIVILAAVTYTYYETVQVENLKEEKESLLQEKRKYKRAQTQLTMLRREYSKLKDISRELELKKAVYTFLSKEKTDFANYFHIAYTVLPDGVWLNNLYLSKDKFRFQGASLNPVQISKLYENLQRYFSKVNFRSTEKKHTRQNVYYTFRISAFDLIKEEE